MDTEEIQIPVPGARLAADVGRAPAAAGVVVFAHGSGSSRHSPRNRAVAAGLVVRGWDTVLADLLTPAEEVADADGRYRFDIDLLAGRVVGVVDWVVAAGGTPVGLFGASTGAAAALVAAATRPAAVRAVVSRGGRPDLAEAALPRVRAATLLVVGGADRQVLALNQAAARRLDAPSLLTEIPGAGHLFAEPGALGQVAAHAADWYERHLRPPTRPGVPAGGHGVDGLR